MKHHLSAPFRFGRLLARKLTDDRQEAVRARLETAQDRINAREAVVAERLGTTPLPDQKPRETTLGRGLVDGATEVGSIVADPALSAVGRGLLRGADWGLHFLGDVIGGILDGLSLFDF